jgi:hypothetical protein
MIERVSEQHLAISAVLLQRRDLIHLEISPNEWRILQDVVHVLRPFKIAPQHLSGGKYPTISSLGPLLHEIRKRIAEDDNDSVAFKEFKKVLRNDTDSRYINPHVKFLLYKASFLDPRFKTLKHLSSIQQEEVSDMILDEVIHLMEEGTPLMEESTPVTTQPVVLVDDDNHESSGEPKQKKPKNVLVDMIGDSFIEATVSSTSHTLQDIARAEVLRYRSEAAIPVDQDPLKWWAVHKNL